MLLLLKRHAPGMLLLLIPVAAIVLLSAASSIMGDLIAAQLSQTLASFNEVLIVVIGIDILMTIGDTCLLGLLTGRPKEEVSTYDGNLLKELRRPMKRPGKP